MAGAVAAGSSLRPTDMRIGEPGDKVPGVQVVQGLAEDCQITWGDRTGHRHVRTKNVIGRPSPYRRSDPGPLRDAWASLVRIANYSQQLYGPPHAKVVVGPFTVLALRRSRVQSDSDIRTLYLANRDDLVGYAYRIVGNRADAEDVVQEAYLRLDRSPEQRLIVEPLAYLYRIVRNLSLDGHRRTERERRRTGPDTDDDTVAGVAAVHPSPEAFAVGRAELQVFARALSELPERNQIALRLHRIEGLTLQQIGKHLGVSGVRAHQLVKEALRHCARRLDDET